MTIQAQIGLAILLFLAGLGAGWKLGTDHEQAKRLDTVTEAVGQLAKDNKSSADAGLEARAEGNQKQATTQAETEDRNERIRKVYVPVAADCVQPPDVMRELESARDAANCAVRAASGVPCPVPPERRRL